MVTTATVTTAMEQHLARDLRAVLLDTEIGDCVLESEGFRAAVRSLEYFIPAVLREIHPEWRHESLDGVSPANATQTAIHEIEIVGTCIIISDQALVPIHTCFRVSAAKDVLESMQCKLGELVGGKMKRIRYGDNHIYRIQTASRKETIQWAYHIGFGAPRESSESRLG